MSEHQRQNVSGLALHLLITIAIGLGAWNLKTTHDLAVSQATFQERLENAVRSYGENRWTFSDQVVWVGELQRENTNLTVPNPALVKARP